MAVSGLLGYGRSAEQPVVTDRSAYLVRLVILLRRVGTCFEALPNHHPLPGGHDALDLRQVALNDAQHLLHLGDHAAAGDNELVDAVAFPVQVNDSLHGHHPRLGEQGWLLAHSVT